MYRLTKDVALAPQHPLIQRVDVRPRHVLDADGNPNERPEPLAQTAAPIRCRLCPAWPALMMRRRRFVLARSRGADGPTLRTRQIRQGWPQKCLALPEKEALCLPRPETPLVFDYLPRIAKSLLIHQITNSGLRTGAPRKKTNPKASTLGPTLKTLKYRNH